MKNSVYLGILLLSFTSCRDVNPHHGLYNALFYDYNKRLQLIDDNLTELVNKEKNLEVESKNLTTVFTEEEKKREGFELYLTQLSLDIKNINSTLNSITYDEKIFKIREIVLQIKEEINNQELFKAHLLKQKRKINENIDAVLNESEEGNRDIVVTFSKKIIDEGKLYLQYKK